MNFSEKEDTKRFTVQEIKKIIRYLNKTAHKKVDNCYKSKINTVVATINLVL